MPTPTLSDDEILRRVEAYKRLGSAAASRELGLDPEQLRRALKKASERGLMLDQPPAMPGFHITKVATDPKGGQFITQKIEPGEVFEMPKTHRLGKMTVNRSADGRVIQDWIRAMPNQLDPLEVAQILKDAFENYTPAAPPVPGPPETSKDFLTLLPCNDWHVGMFAWGPEVGENWDLKIAERTIGENIENVILRSLPSSVCVVLGGGDLMHADNMRNETDRSKNPLDVDGRYAKVLEVAQRMMVRTINASLRHHDHIIGRILRGNHDEHSSIAIAHFLKAWYRNEPRVTIDTDPSLYWWHRFGNVMLGATHGHTVKLRDMPGIMAARRAADWGATEFRYAHGFHVHHREKLATEGLGVICEAHQAPIPQDAFHFGSGYLSGRSLQAITYHREFGEWDRVGKGIRNKVAA